MHTTYNTCVILLYRPLLQRHRLGPTEIQICIDAALSTVTLAKAYDLTYSMAKTPVHMSQVLQLTLAAALTNRISMRQALSSISC
jgi:hypothetical protein